MLKLTKDELDSENRVPKGKGLTSLFFFIIIAFNIEYKKYLTK